MYFEHKALYRSVSGPVPADYYEIEIGKARHVRAGDEVSIITYGSGVHWAEEYAASHPEISIDILDLRTLLPLDYLAIRASVQRTGRVLILHEDTLTGGIGGEIAAWIAEHCFSLLDAPVMREKQPGKSAEAITVSFDSSYQPAVFTDASRLEKIKAVLPVIDSLYTSFARANHFPGMAFGIVVDGQLVHAGNFGYTDIDKRIPVTSSSLFRIASMTKSFTAMAILKLRDEGRLDLDDPASLYIPALKNLRYPTADASPITFIICLFNFFYSMIDKRDKVPVGLNTEATYTTPGVTVNGVPKAISCQPLAVSPVKVT
ncbi:Transketolase protein, partial [Ostertagia ostertagi]